MPSSKELRDVTDKSIADIFVNYGLATSRYVTLIKERVFQLTNAGVYDFENERSLIGKEGFAKAMETFKLAKDEAFTR